MTPQPGPVNGLQDVAFIPQSDAVWAVDAGDLGMTSMLHWNGTAWH